MNEPINDTKITNDTNLDDGTAISLVLPNLLHRRLKSRAALAGRHLKTYLLDILASTETRDAP